MGIRGPAPQPAELKLLQGNPGRRPIDPDAGIRPAAAIPLRPDHLALEAAEEWDRITPELLALGLLSHIDRAALAMYCTAWGRHVYAENKIRELQEQGEGDRGLVGMTESGYKMQSVWVQISNKSMEQCDRFLASFGMSPSARARMTAAAELTQSDLFTGTGHAKPSLAAFATRK